MHPSAQWLIAGQPGWLLLALAIGALVCLVLACRYWSLAHRVADTARARVRSAPHGYVELYGRAEFAQPAKQRVAPLTGRSCVWWQYRIYERAGRSWTQIDHGTSESVFLLRDDTGACLVDPAGAAIKPSARQVWYGSESWPTSPFSTGLGLLGSRYRYIEQRIHEYDGVCALGEFAAVGGVATGDIDEQVAALLHDWKADQAALLQRFDRDGDGQLNAAEWQQAREAARSQVLGHQTQAPLVKQMARPRDGRPYLLAARNPRQLAQAYRWQAAASLAGFFGTLLILTRALLHG